MKLKTNHRLFVNLLLNAVTFGIWNLLVLRDDLREGEVVLKQSLNIKLIFILLFIPFTSGIGSILALVAQIKVLNGRCELLEANGLKPQTTALRYVLSFVFGFLTLGIWPLVEKINYYRLWNKANELVNNQQSTEQAA